MRVLPRPLCGPHHLHFISAACCFAAWRFNFRLNAKQKVFLLPSPEPEPERERKVACWLGLSWLDLAKRSTRQKTLPYISDQAQARVSNHRKWPRGNLFNLINFHNLSWWATKFPSEQWKTTIEVIPLAHCLSVSQWVSRAVWPAGNLTVWQSWLWFNFFIALDICWGRKQLRNLTWNLNCFVNVLWLERTATTTTTWFIYENLATFREGTSENVF